LILFLIFNILIIN